MFLLLRLLVSGTCVKFFVLPAYVPFDLCRPVFHDLRDGVKQLS